MCVFVQMERAPVERLECLGTTGLLLQDTYSSGQGKVQTHFIVGFGNTGVVMKKGDSEHRSSRPGDRDLSVCFSSLWHL